MKQTPMNDKKNKKEHYTEKPSGKKRPSSKKNWPVLSNAEENSSNILR